jgi:carboxylesterase
MGGILSLRFASLYPITGVVAMATPFSLPDDPRLPFLPIVSPLLKWVKAGPADWHNQEAAKDHVCYPYYPTRSILQLRDLLTEMRASLPDVKVPALLIYSHQDKSVVPPNAEKVYSALGSQQKKLIWVENSGHNIPREADRLIAFSAINDFIKQVSGSD